MAFSLRWPKLLGHGAGEGVDKVARLPEAKKKKLCIYHFPSRQFHAGRLSGQVDASREAKIILNNELFAIYIFLFKSILKINYIG